MLFLPNNNFQFLLNILTAPYIMPKKTLDIQTDNLEAISIHKKLMH
jgi:hypothetical protein